jgi:hypothetical protein
MRCQSAMPMTNFLADAANQDQFGVDDPLLRQEIWHAAATVPVRQMIVEGLALGYFRRWRIRGRGAREGELTSNRPSGAVRLWGAGTAAG